MEQLRTRGDDGLHRNLRDLLECPAGVRGEWRGGRPRRLVAAATDFPELDALALDGLSEREARSTVLGLLRGAGVELGGSNRPPEEIVERLLVKLRRPRVDFDIAHAIAFLRRLITLRGEPATVLADTRALLADYGLDDAPVQELEEVLALLKAYGHHQRIILDLGLGRGLHYYTGVLFEVHTGETNGARGAIQLCGGGRYDDLAQILGARARSRRAASPAASSGSRRRWWRAAHRSKNRRRSISSSAVLVTSGWPS